jgi:putative tryptophan/tyrosine transport system substrate-binding protein
VGNRRPAAGPCLPDRLSGNDSPPLWEPLLDGLRERGYLEGEHVVFERRFSEGHAERFPAFAAEMVRLRVWYIRKSCPRIWTC